MGAFRGQNTGKGTSGVKTGQGSKQVTPAWAKSIRIIKNNRSFQESSPNVLQSIMGKNKTAVLRTPFRNRDNSLGPNESPSRLAGISELPATDSSLSSTERGRTFDIRNSTQIQFDRVPRADKGLTKHERKLKSIKNEIGEFFSPMVDWQKTAAFGNVRYEAPRSP